MTKICRIYAGRLKAQITVNKKSKEKASQKRDEAKEEMRRAETARTKACEQLHQTKLDLAESRRVQLNAETRLNVLEAQQQVLRQQLAQAQEQLDIQIRRHRERQEAEDDRPGPECNVPDHAHVTKPPRQPHDKQRWRKRNEKWTTSEEQQLRPRAKPKMRTPTTRQPYTMFNAKQKRPRINTNRSSQHSAKSATTRRSSPSTSRASAKGKPDNCVRSSQ